MEHHQSILIQPLIHGGQPKTKTTHLSPNNDDPHDHHHSGNGITIRFLSLIFIGVISLWANQEASKGFDITIINDAKRSPAGKRFNLFYISNDKATRIILNTSNFIEHLLYPVDSDHPKKHVKHVALRLLSLNLSDDNMGVVVHSSSEEPDNFTVNISPSVMEEANVNRALVSAIERGMSRVWLWGGESGAPPELVAGMVEYIRMAAEGFSRMKSYGGGAAAAKLAECEGVWWEDKDPKVVARLLNYYEGYNKGFIQRLNGAMKDKWHDRTVDDALGMPSQNLCRSYDFSMYNSDLGTVSH